MNDKNLPVFVELVNDVGRAARFLQGYLHPLAAEFVGKKIYRADGTLTVAFKDYLGLPVAAADRRCRGMTILHSPSNYELSFMVKGCANYGERCIYHEEYVRIGGVERGVLFRVPAGGEPCRTDWTVAEVLAARKRYAEAEEAMREARRACGPFGER